MREVEAHSENSGLPTLLGAVQKQGQKLLKLGEGQRKECAGDEICTLSSSDYAPDFEQKLGSGAYGHVYPVVGMPDKVVKIFRRGGWDDVVKEATFGRRMSRRHPAHFVDCLGVGTATDANENRQHHFAVFARAGGITLEEAAPRFHQPSGLRHVAQALEVLQQLAGIMGDMLRPAAGEDVQVHLDLKPQNIMVSTEEDGGVQVSLVDYGLVQLCPSSSSSENTAQLWDAALQLFRWLGWEVLWVLASEAFYLNGREDQSPWQQLPEGFRPFFWRSDFRPKAYRTERLTPERLRAALQEDFFSKVMSPPFRRQWRSQASAKAQVGRLLGELFYGVALASDRCGYKPDFDYWRQELRALQALASSSRGDCEAR